MITAFMTPSSPSEPHDLMISTNALASIDQRAAFFEYAESSIVFLNEFWKITPEMATPIAWPKARKNEYKAFANGRSAFTTELWTVKARAEKVAPPPIPGTRQRNIQDATLVVCLR